MKDNILGFVATGSLWRLPNFFAVVEQSRPGWSVANEVAVFQWKFVYDTESWITFNFTCHTQTKEESPSRRILENV